VRGLRVDLEGVLVVEDIRIKALTATELVYYKRIRHGRPCSRLALRGTDECSGSADGSAGAAPTGVAAR
jgi:hypothetical protein